MEAAGSDRATIGDRLAELDAARFVGRGDELRRLESLLVDEPERNIVLLHGPGGIGKSTLLREVLRRANRRGWPSRVVEARDLPEQPRGLRAVLDDLRASPLVVVVFDSWEEAEPLTAHLQDLVLRDVPAGWVVVISSRNPPAPSWGQDGWEHVTTELRVGPLADEDALACAIAHGAPDDQAADLVPWARGLPLAIVLAASTGMRVDDRISADVAAPLVRRMLGDWLERLPVLACAANARITTPALLADAVPDSDGAEGFRWLSRQPFVEAVGHGIMLHAAISDALRWVVADAHPDLDRDLRRRIAQHVHAVAVAEGASVSLDLSVMLQNPAMRWGVGWDPTGRLLVDRARPGDGEAIATRLEPLDRATWWPKAARFFHEASDLVWVIRKREDPVGFMIVATSDDECPIDDDPVLAPWLRHARERAALGASVIWRNSRSLDGDAGVQSLLGAAGLALSGVANPRFLYLPIDPALPTAMAFSASLGAEHLPELDVNLGEGTTECHVIDTGPGGTLGAQLASVLAECGRAPTATKPPVLDAGTVRTVLRSWDRPDQLAECAFAAGANRRERAASVRSIIRAAVALAFGSGPRERLLLEVLEAGCLGRTSTHEQAAIDLHLSRSAYYRHLRTATDRVVAQLVGGPPTGGTD